MPSRPQPDSPNDTRERLLQAALAAFARHDFDAVSVRRIVDQAGANVSAVSYHFGGKRQLYLATAEFLADTLRARLGATLSEIAAHAREATPDAAADRLREMIGALAGHLLDDRLGDDAAGFILREQHQPTEAFDILYDRLMRPIQETFQLLVERLLGPTHAAPQRLILVTHALLGQVIGFRLARTTVLRRLGQDAFDDADIAQITDVISELTLNALRGDQQRTTPR